MSDISGSARTELRPRVRATAPAVISEAAITLPSSVSRKARPPISSSSPPKNCDRSASVMSAPTTQFMVPPQFAGRATLIPGWRVVQKI